MPGVVVHGQDFTQDDLLGESLISNLNLEKPEDTTTEALINTCGSHFSKSEVSKNMPPERGHETEVQMDISNFCHSNGSQPTLDVDQNGSIESKVFSNGDHKPSDSVPNGKTVHLQNGESEKAKPGKEKGKMCDIRQFFFKVGSNKRPSDSGSNLAAKKPHLEKLEEEPTAAEKRITNGCNNLQTDELTQKIIAGIFLCPKSV